MDIGGFRDFHRHRRCTQIIQDFTALHGYETPGSGDLPAGSDILAEAGILSEYRTAIDAAHRTASVIAAAPIVEAAQSATYLYPRPRASALSSKSTLPRPSTSRSYALALQATSAIAASRGRCISNSRANTPRSPRTCA